MKRIYTLSLSLLGTVLLFGQSAPPQGINYQAVLVDKNVVELPGRDIANMYLANTDVEVRFSIVPMPAVSVEYEEVHNTTTDEYGLINLVIGQGTPMNGTVFDSIKWENEPKYLQVEIKLDGGEWEIYSLERLWSVPYALYSKEAQIADSIRGVMRIADRDSQLLSIVGDSLFISNGNAVFLPKGVDTSKTNEFQDLELKDDSLLITNGKGVLLPRDEDRDSTNELQDLILESDSIGLTRSDKRISISDLINNNNGRPKHGGLTRLNKFECYAPVSYVNVDSLFQAGQYDHFVLHCAGDDRYVVENDGKWPNGNRRGGLYLVRKDRSIRELMDATGTNPSAQNIFYNKGLFYFHFQTSSSYRFASRNFTGSKLICIDTTGSFKWSADLIWSSYSVFLNQYFVASNHISNMVIPSGKDYSLVNLSNGSVNTTRKSYNFMITEKGICREDGRHESFDGTPLPNCIYVQDKTPENYHLLNSADTSGISLIYNNETYIYSDNRQLELNGKAFNSNLKHYTTSLEGMPSLTSINWFWNSMRNSKGYTVFCTPSYDNYSPAILSNVSTDVIGTGTRKSTTRSKDNFLLYRNANEVSTLGIWPAHAILGSIIDDNSIYVGLETFRMPTCINSNELRSQLIIMKYSLD